MEAFSPAYFVSIYVKLFALFAPPLALTAFLSGAADYSPARKRRTAHKTAVAVFIIGALLLFCGRELFALFGFTLDAFRIGSGSLLFLTAVSMMRSSGHSTASPAAEEDDISVVPLAVPIVLGPATIGALMVLGAEPAARNGRLTDMAGLLAATLSLWAVLLLAEKIQKLLGTAGFSIMTKLTGLLLSAIAAQIVFDGIRSFMK